MQEWPTTSPGYSLIAEADLVHQPCFSIVFYALKNCAGVTNNLWSMVAPNLWKRILIYCKVFTGRIESVGTRES